MTITRRVLVRGGRGAAFGLPMRRSATFTILDGPGDRFHRGRLDPIMSASASAWTTWLGLFAAHGADQDGHRLPEQDIRITYGR